MKRFIFLFLIPLIPFFLINCGGGSSTENSFDKNLPTMSSNRVSYDIWDYIVPSGFISGKSTSSQSLDGTTYRATYRIIGPNNIVEEIPENATDEKVVYEENNNTILVKFYKNNNLTYSYNINRSVKVGKQIVANSSCMLANHYDYKYINGTKYIDVIEIACGKHKGYYSKRYGEIYQE
jgi:hypothetical protein